MGILSFFFEVVGATMLLLFSVRLVRTGMERAHGASLKRLLSNQSSLISGAMTGLSLAVVIQSSAAVVLLSAGFLASGYLKFYIALAIVLGGDLGSALVVQILSFPVGWVVAPLLAIGGWLSTKVGNQRLRHYGRIVMGVALILVALELLREAVAPVRDGTYLPLVASYLETDPLTAFLVGALLAFMMHSGVASILVIVTLVQIDAISLSAGIAVVLGANLGSGVIPVWLTRSMGIEARRLAITNLILRGTFSTIFLFLWMAASAYKQINLQAFDQAQTLIFIHIGFNAALLLLALPFCRPLAALASRFIHNDSQVSELKTKAVPGSHLSDALLESPNLALTGIKQELMRMSGLVEAMFRPSLDIYLKNQPELLASIQKMDSQVNACLTSIRDFVSSIPRDQYSKPDARAARDMIEYAIRLEAAGDVISKRMTELASALHQKRSGFSPEGQEELSRIHDTILANFKLAANVLISDDPESARRLSLEKTDIKRLERKSRNKHLKRLQNGNLGSQETSDVHLETLRALREISSHISAVAYPVLYETGQLLETRLIQKLPPA